jgi:hypothetical protein
LLDLAALTFLVCACFFETLAALALTLLGLIFFAYFAALPFASLDLDFTYLG